MEQKKQWDTCYGVSVVYHSLVSRYRIMETVPSWYGCKIYNQHVYLHISKPEVQTLWNFLYVNCGHCLVLLLWKCNRYELLDVIFAHNGQWLWCKWGIWSGSYMVYDTSNAVLQNRVISNIFIMVTTLFDSVIEYNSSKLHTGVKAYYVPTAAQFPCLKIVINSF